MRGAQSTTALTAPPLPCWSVSDWGLLQPSFRAGCSMLPSGFRSAGACAQGGLILALSAVVLCAPLILAFS
eukprot:CAMPEP_0206263098 /NCGR_PEP_ID=MMETSP0047_2-20121206/28623_1 /ASSEMBLY_ACC=CAM_ASM_000192 /TAXON_ID=195065 /ORGANISM="Chroomonas mesostigmatica_cf, Strain CCMP1168" /LENGTH=70 /DNA_ID=CAMNT_0053690589 /DNA_START=5 /DNA_END=214 /DNA_ORIENTATION=-